MSDRIPLHTAHKAVLVGRLSKILVNLSTWFLFQASTTRQQTYENGCIVLQLTKESMRILRSRLRMFCRRRVKRPLLCSCPVAVAASGGRSDERSGASLSNRVSQPLIPSCLAGGDRLQLLTRFRWRRGSSATRSIPRRMLRIRISLFRRDVVA